MRILVGMMHPKHVYMFKNFIHAMENRGHEVEIVAVEKDITIRLLNEFKLPHKIIGKNPPSLSGKLISLPKWIYHTYKIAQNFKPDIFIGQAFPPFAYISKSFNKPYIIFEDTESATLVQKLCFPFASKIVTPKFYTVDIGEKHIRVDGFFELAYLHPNWFHPNPSILKECGFKENEKIIIIRFVSWNALHDIGQSGISDDNKNFVIQKLKEFGHILVSSEGPVPEELKKYLISGNAKKNIHDLIFYSTLVFGESPTMTTESALLGTPSICVSSWACTCGNFQELKNKYGMIFCSSDPEDALNYAIELLKNEKLKYTWKNKREILLNDKIDITSYMVDLIQKYDGMEL